MKIVITVILLITHLSSLAFSGEIYGCIKKNGRFIKEKVQITITPDGHKGEPYTAYTDKYGTYRLYVQETGECKLKMDYITENTKRPVYLKDMGTPDFLVYSYEGSVQYDFFIEQKDGKYFFRRK